MREAVARHVKNGIAFIEKGDGEALLMIHGVGLNAEAWGPQIEALSETYRVIALDMPGHGKSSPPAAGASISDYVAQAVSLLDALGIAKANVAGHSMGGLVALGLALDHPERVLRIAVLNSVYERTPDARRAVEARAAEIALSRSCGDIEQPLRRWLGDAETPLHQQVRRWLGSMDPVSYACAYRIFATGDRLYSGRFGTLQIPALFATGSEDQNSTPGMAEAMAAAAPRGKAVVLEGQRHMMGLVDVAGTNRILRELLAQPVAAFEPRLLRNAFGSFMTGVTVVTAMDEAGEPRGFTANSFTSVSLDPPLLLVCIARSASSCHTFSKAKAFAVNILAEDQKHVSAAFASRRPDKFTGIAWRKSENGQPLIEGALSWFDCARHELVDAGDHVILLGAIRGFAARDANPLGYARGGYVTLGLEEAAVDAASASRTIVGAILECGGMLLAERDAGTGKLRLPEVGRTGASGTASLLHAALARKATDAQLGFLFAVFENPETRVQSIYYRGDAAAAGNLLSFSFDALPYDDFCDEAVRAMLRRYADERQQGRFRIYSGNHERGEVKAIG
jgi:flavin reductase (DIM6/NTAB) family NADH-FMN oxidoreductase RutF/pimeloyl-ACP methyl ester carboxylesterase